MKRIVRSYLIGVLVLDAAAAALYFGPPLIAQVTPAPLSVAVPTPSSGDAAGPTPERDALLLLGRALAERQQELERREAELAEILRSEEVLLRAQALEPPEPTPEVGSIETPAVAVRAETDGAHPGAEAFDRLSKAYESMEPDSAALAMAELAALDRDAVLQLLATWRPRTSGAILDSLTQNRPEVAAQLTYEMWKRSGKLSPPAASPDR